MKTTVYATVYHSTYKTADIWQNPENWSAYINGFEIITTTLKALKLAITEKRNELQANAEKEVNRFLAEIAPQEAEQTPADLVAAIQDESQNTHFKIEVIDTGVILKPIYMGACYWHESKHFDHMPALLNWLASIGIQDKATALQTLTAVYLKGWEYA